VTQRIADFINSAWQRAGFGGVPIEIVGVDLNQSRIENAKKLTESPHPDITLSFEVGDVTDGLQFNDEYFDYVVVTGVFEALDDLLFQTFMQEIKRLAWGGVYVHEPIESPGGYPRPDIADEFTSAGFSVERYEKVFKEPFTETGTNDPLEIWPNLINQVLFATKDENQPFENRW
jgi:ubiquinone/menaquinone biosynthesis C-methylase UbiE